MTTMTYSVVIRKTVVMTQTVVVTAKNKKQAELAAQELGDDLNADTKATEWRALPETVTPVAAEPKALELTKAQWDLYQTMLDENSANGGDFGVLECVVSPFKKAAYQEMLATLETLVAIKELGIVVHDAMYVNEGKGLKNRVTQYTIPRNDKGATIEVLTKVAA